MCRVRVYCAYYLVKFFAIPNSVHDGQPRYKAHCYLCYRFGCYLLREQLLRTAYRYDVCPYLFYAFPLSDFAAELIAALSEFEYLYPSVEFSYIH